MKLDEYLHKIIIVIIIAMHFLQREKKIHTKKYYFLYTIPCKPFK